VINIDLITPIVICGGQEPFFTID